MELNLWNTDRSLGTFHTPPDVGERSTKWTGNRFSEDVTKFEMNKAVAIASPADYTDVSTNGIQQ
jgi:hypothetical protein